MVILDYVYNETTKEFTPCPYINCKYNRNPTLGTEGCHDCRFFVLDDWSAELKKGVIFCIGDEHKLKQDLKSI